MDTPALPLFVYATTPRITRGSLEELLPDPKQRVGFVHQGMVSVDVALVYGTRFFTGRGEGVNDSKGEVRVYIQHRVTVRRGKTAFLDRPRITNMMNKGEYPRGADVLEHALEEADAYLVHVGGAAALFANRDTEAVVTGDLYTRAQTSEFVPVGDDR